MKYRNKESKSFKLGRRTRSKLKREHQVAILVGVVAVIVLTSLSLLPRLSSLGQTALQNTPLVTPLDLDLIGESLIDLNVNPSFQVKMTTSNRENFVLNLVVEKLEGMVEYTLYLNRMVIAKGLLDTTVSSSGAIPVDQDFKPDLELAYDGTYFLVKNLNFIAPAVARFTFLDQNFQLITENMLNVKVGTEQIFYFNVSSTSLPQVNGVFANLEEFSSPPVAAGSSSTSGAPAVGIIKGTNTSSNISIATAHANYLFTEYKTGENYKLMKLVWTPKEEKTYKFTLGAVVGGQISSKTYLFAGNGLIYELKDEDSPSIRMVLNPDLKKVDVSFSFPRSNELQPFSLPCMGLVELRELTSRGNVAKVYGYTDKINQWQAGAASDLSRLRSGKGYVLKLADAQQPLSFTTSCSLEGLELPSLAVGWNFIGVPGYRTYSLSELTVPPGRKISQSYELLRSGEHSAVTSLEPGKAYWISVE